MFNVNIIPSFKATRDLINLGSDVMSDKVKELRSNYDLDAPVREANARIYEEKITDRVRTKVTDYIAQRPTFSEEQVTLVDEFLKPKAKATTQDPA